MDLPRRVAILLLERIGLVLWGFRPRLMPHIVEQWGALPALGWFVANMPRYERTLTRLGPRRTHLVTTVTSILNGCPYCTYGHAYAYNLHYFRDEGRPFALGEQDLVGLIGKDDATAQLRSALQDGASAAELPAFERLLALREGAAPATDEDRRIAHLDRMLSALNACGIQGCVAPDEAHDPINKDAALKQAYAASR